MQGKYKIVVTLPEQVSGFMKYFFIILFLLTICKTGKSQEITYSFYQLYQLDSIGKSPSIGRHFGELYFNFLLLVEAQLKKTDSSTERLVRNFEAIFAQFFIDACIAYKNGDQIHLPEWKKYFSDTTLQPIQYKLLGANAHLNGVLAIAIAGSYTTGEWEPIKKKYILFNSCLNKTYRLVYEEAVTTNKRAKLLGILTLGMDRFLGNYYLYKWRKRQMRLTEFAFTKSSKYHPLLNKINRKKVRIDKLVIKHL